MSRRNGTGVKVRCRRNGSRRNGTNHRRNGSRRNGSNYNLTRVRCCVPEKDTSSSLFSTLLQSSCIQKYQLAMLTELERIRIGDPTKNEFEDLQLRFNKD